MNHQLHMKTGFERWMEENRDSIIVVDISLKEFDNIMFVLVSYVRKEG